MPAEEREGFGYWRDPVFLGCLAVYFLNREWIKPSLHTYSPFFHGHLNDCLLVPVALPLFLWVYRRLELRPDDAPPRLWEMVLHVLVWIVVFERFGPQVLHRSQADGWDAVCYLAGGLVAWLLWRQGWRWPVRRLATT